MISNGTTLARDVGQPVAQSTRKRSGSIESNHSSLQPSIADSVTRLVPATYTQSPGNQPHPSTNRASGRPISDRMRASMRQRAEPTDLSTSNDLTTEQRQILLRRVKTLEKRLGEPLREAETGRWVVQPSSVVGGDARGPNLSTASDGSPAAGNAGASPLSRSKTIDSAWSREILDQDETQQDRAQRRRQLAKVIWQHHATLQTLIVVKQAAWNSGPTTSTRSTDISSAQIFREHADASRWSELHDAGRSSHDDAPRFRRQR